MKKLNFLKFLFIPFSLATVSVVLPLTLTSCSSNKQNDKSVVYYDELKTSKNDVDNFRQEMSNISIKKTHDGKEYVDWSSIKNSIENTLHIPMDAIGIMDIGKSDFESKSDNSESTNQWVMVLYLNNNYHWSDKFIEDGLQYTNGEDNLNDYYVYSYALQFNFIPNFEHISIDTNKDLRSIAECISDLPTNSDYKLNEWNDGYMLGYPLGIRNFVPGSVFEGFKVTNATNQEESYELDIALRPRDYILLKSNDSFLNEINLKNVSYSTVKYDFTSSINGIVNNYISQEKLNETRTIWELNKKLFTLNAKLKKLLGTNFHKIIAIPNPNEFEWDDYSAIKLVLLFKGNVEIKLSIDNNFKLSEEFPYALLSASEILTNIS